MNCKNCGAEILEGQKFCASCGARIEESLIHNAVKSEENENKKVEKDVPTEKAETKPTKKVCGFGIAGMVLGIVSFCCDTWNTASFGFSLITAILGLIFSCISFKKFKSGNYKLKGFHIAGLVLSIISLSAIVIVSIVSILYSVSISLGAGMSSFSIVI